MKRRSERGTAAALGLHRGQELERQTTLILDALTVTKFRSWRSDYARIRCSLRAVLCCIAQGACVVVDAAKIIATSEYTCFAWHLDVALQTRSHCQALMLLQLVCGLEQ